MSAFKFAERLKKRWNISTDKDFVLIMLVFSLAGAGVGFERRKVFEFLGLNHSHLWIQILAWLLLIVPLYQISTIFFSIFLGQFNFFWGRQKAIGRGIKNLFLNTPSNSKS